MLDRLLRLRLCRGRELDGLEVVAEPVSQEEAHPLAVLASVSDPRRRLNLGELYRINRDNRDFGNTGAEALADILKLIRKSIGNGHLDRQCEPVALDQKIGALKRPRQLLLGGRAEPQRLRQRLQFSL